jgi:hypothetical protein
VLCGTLVGAENFVQIERWAKRKIAVLAGCCRSRTGFRRMVPSMM